MVIRMEHYFTFTSPVSRRNVFNKLQHAVQDVKKTITKTYRGKALLYSQPRKTRKKREQRVKRKEAYLKYCK